MSHHSKASAGLKPGSLPENTDHSRGVGQMSPRPGKEAAENEGKGGGGSQVREGRRAGSVQKLGHREGTEELDGKPRTASAALPSPEIAAPGAQLH